MSSDARKILIVDDEPDTVVFLEAWLQDQGYRTCSASDGREGLQAVFAERPDLILLDLNMPNQTGNQFYRQMCSEESCRGTPVIFITGMTNLEIFDGECSPLPKPVAFFEKPFDLRALHDAIKRALDKSRLS